MYSGRKKGLLLHNGRGLMQCTWWLSDTSRKWKLSLTLCCRQFEHLSNSCSQIGLVEWKSILLKPHLTLILPPWPCCSWVCWARPGVDGGKDWLTYTECIISSTWLLWSYSNEIPLRSHMRHKYIHTLPIQSIHIYTFPRPPYHQLSNYVPSKFQTIQPNGQTLPVSMICRSSYLSSEKMNNQAYCSKFSHWDYFSSLPSGLPPKSGHSAGAIHFLHHRIQNYL